MYKCFTPAVERCFSSCDTDLALELALPILAAFRTYLIYPVPEIVVSDRKIGLHFEFLKRPTNFSSYGFGDKIFLAARENSIHVHVVTKYNQRDLEINVQRFTLSHHSIAHMLELFTTHL